MSWRDERGSGTVLWLGVIGTVIAVTMLLLGVGSALVAAGRARHAADAAALAGAQVVLDGGGPDAACERARRLAESNGAHLVSCDTGTGDLQVEVSVAPGVRVVPQDAHAIARAGDPALAVAP